MIHGATGLTWKRGYRNCTFVRGLIVRARKWKESELYNILY